MPPASWATGRTRPRAASSARRPGALGLLVPPLTNPVYTRIIRGAFERALERDFVVLLVEDVDPLQADRTASRLVQAGRIDGLMIASARPGHPLLRSVRRDRVPHVFVNRGVAKSGRNVVIDEAGASAAALEHLLSLGHRRIGHVAGPRALDTARRRTNGFVEAAASHGLKVEVAEGDFGESGGATAAQDLLGRRPGPDRALHEHAQPGRRRVPRRLELGIDVPAELSLVGYDDMPLAEYLRPPLTTVRTPLAELGAAAVDALVEQLLGGEPSDVVVGADPEVVVRSSTGEPR